MVVDVERGRGRVHRNLGRRRTRKEMRTAGSIAVTIKIDVHGDCIHCRKSWRGRGQQWHVVLGQRGLYLVVAENDGAAVDFFGFARSSIAVAL